MTVYNLFAQKMTIQLRRGQKEKWLKKKMFNINYTQDREQLDFSLDPPLSGLDY